MGNYIINLAEASSFVDMGEKGISLFFNRRWTLINADVRRDIALLMNDGRELF
jgi:hypothetical protein